MHVSLDTITVEPVRYPGAKAPPAQQLQLFDHKRHAVPAELHEGQEMNLILRSDEVEHSWRFIQSIHDAWETLPAPTFPNYYPFTDGPDEANRLFEGTEGTWRSLRSV